MKLTGRLLVIVLFLCTSALGSSVLQVTFEQLVTSAEAIFQGEVIAVDSRLDPDQTGIHTYVTFRVDEVLQGSIGRHLVLRFLGGTVDDIRVEVAGSTLPKIAERGIYFVEGVDRFLVNPFYGFDQGHFLVIQSGAQEVVATRGRRVITGFLPHDSSSKAGLSNGIATGLSVEDAGPEQSGVTTAQFKQKIRAYLKNQ